jgi:N-acetylmuramoyl-L-alanine amidase
MRDVTLIIIHCAATKPSMDVDAKWIDRVHRSKGFLKIGYHFFIKRDGTVEKGRPVSEIGAHARGYNAESIGICMAGGVTEKDVNVPENNFTEAQWRMLPMLLKQLKADFPAARIIGHREVEPAKACPSFDVQVWLKENYV